MLEPKEKDLVVELLVSEVALRQSPRASLAATLPGTLFPQQLTQGNPRELVLNAVQLCLNRAWADTPTWLETLITAFSLDTLDPAIALILQRLRVPPPAPAGDQRDVKLLNNVTPFVNRDPLRQKLRALEDMAAKARPILIVDGGTKIGKSYSVNYIEHYSNVRPGITPHRVDFDSELGLELNPEMVARELISSTGRPVGAIPPSQTNMKLYVRQLADWVLNEAAIDATTQHWFILDNFKGDTLRSDTRAFLIALSDRLMTGVYRERCRLILIGFDRTQLTVEPGRVDEEIIKLCTQADIDSTIAEILQRAPVAIPAGSISPVLMNGLATGQYYMEDLNARLRGLLYAINELNPLVAAAPQLDFVEILLEMIKGLPGGKDCQPELQRRLEALKSVA